MDRVYNFSAGPANLPLSVLEEARRDLLSYPGAGMSVMEMSHRSKWFAEIIGEAENNIRKLLGLNDQYHVLFLHGGARLQFSMIPINLLGHQNKGAEYIVTGSWGDKAAKEAKREGQVKITWTGKNDQFNRVPNASELQFDSNSAYVHFTSNETIEGVQFQNEPASGNVALVCDASSDILSRPIPIEKYGLIYAGAQKNIGPAGVALVIIRDDLVHEIKDENLHAMLDYRIHIKNKSLYNTPPAFPIYMIMLVTRWILNDRGGLKKIHQENQKKAQLLYDAIDQSHGFYQGHAQKESRSLMNVTWKFSNDDLQKKFLEQALIRNFFELTGHRSVGGIRASIYNAMPLEGITALRDFMISFQKENA